MLQKQTYVVRHKTTRRALICSYGRHFCECPCELTLGRETKTEISCEWNTKISIIPEIPLKRVHSKRIPKFSKTFTGIFTVPFSFGPEISEILVEWKAPYVTTILYFEATATKLRDLGPLHMIPVNRAGSVTEMKLVSVHMATLRASSFELAEIRRY